MDGTDSILDVLNTIERTSMQNERRNGDEGIGVERYR